jgi:hypothetical protein
MTFEVSAPEQAPSGSENPENTPCCSHTTRTLAEVLGEHGANIIFAFCSPFD